MKGGQREKKIKLPAKIEQYLLQEEGKELDFKLEVSDGKKIAKTLSAFSNTAGGVLLIGINDQKQIKGINPGEELFMLEKAVNEYCKPQIDYEYREWTIGKKTVLEVKIPESAVKPVYALGDDEKWWAYVRHDDNTILASKVVLEVLRRRSSDKSVMVTYSEQARKLLEYLRDNKRITLDEYCSQTGINKRKATGILVSLIIVGILDVTPGENDEFFTLKNVGSSSV
jgi:predicted HTH transcriptional regulator